jgi:hypothetical protein
LHRILRDSIWRHLPFYCIQVRNNCGSIRSLEPAVGSDCTDLWLSEYYSFSSALTLDVDDHLILSQFALGYLLGCYEELSLHMQISAMRQVRPQRRSYTTSYSLHMWWRAVIYNQWYNGFTHGPLWIQGSPGSRKSVFAAVLFSNQLSLSPARRVPVLYLLLPPDYRYKSYACHSAA